MVHEKQIRKSPCFFSCLFIVFCFFFISVSLTHADELKQMQFDINETVQSGQNFTVSIFEINMSNESITPYLIDVTIIFNNNTYLIPPDDDGELTLIAPYVMKNTSYEIEAQKQNYQTITTSILVTPYKPTDSKRLIITPEEFTVDAEKQFIVTIYDETGMVIEGATVGIQDMAGEESVTISNELGRAVLIAPNKNKISLIAQKQGYQDATETIWINTNAQVFLTFYKNPITPIIIAVVILLAVVLYVRFKIQPGQSLPVSKRKDYQLLDEEKKERKQSEPKESIRFQRKQAKIEEIRITKNQPSKEIIPIHRSKDTSSASSYHKRKKTDTYYEGNQALAYTIDKITKSADEIKKDKWFEGTDDIQEKIDRALREKQKKEKEKVR